MNCIKNIKEINLNNKEDLKLVKDYDINIYNSIKKRLRKKEDNIITDIFLASTKTNKIENFYTIHIEKDTKIASIYANIKNNKEKIISVITEDLLQENYIETVFIFIEKNNIKLINYLMEKGFMSLGDESDTKYIPLIKEKQNTKERDGSNISWKY